jgi:hypothetical protein
MIISKRRFDFQAPLFWKVIRRDIVYILNQSREFKNSIIYYSNKYNSKIIRYTFPESQIYSNLRFVIISGVSRYIEPSYIIDIMDTDNCNITCSNIDI